ncbi:restriction endonuclease subunit S [Phocaeicola plebeius]|uniref:restriction endonuclease subunit S n=2 Tax=Phocaeicola plebeius TaxID=310297 RepID=UPI0026E9E080|nr:restriction endonuclease subunit S [Phocaeicola plebeius]
MSKLQELIKKLCPDGVEFRKLGEVCEIYTGGEPPKDTIKGDNKDEKHVYPVWANGKEVYGYSSTYKIDKDATVISSIGANTGSIYFRKAYFTPIIRLKVLVPKNNNLISKYLYYYLSTVTFVVKSSSVPNMNANEVKKLEIPLPPLEVQNEIVRILDTFTSHTAELQAELQARKEQYEYYRNKLLTFDENDERVKWMTLGDVCFYPRQRIPVSLLHKNNYVGVDNLLPNKQGKKESNCVPSEGSCLSYTINDILIGNIRPYLKKIWISNNNGGTNGDVLIYRIREEFLNCVMPKYLYYILSSDDFFDFDNQYAKGAKMPRGDKNMNMKYSVPIPLFSEQQRIISILDKFESLVNDLSEGLPAEIAAVQEQYEYYRNKLLTFKRKS